MYIINILVSIHLHLFLLFLSVLTEGGQWSVGSLIDPKDYQQKSLSLLETRQWWQNQLLQLPTEKEIKLTRYVQSLHHELQVYQENKESLQEALLETSQHPQEKEGLQGMDSECMSV